MATLLRSHCPRALRALHPLPRTIPAISAVPAHSRPRSPLRLPLRTLATTSTTLPSQPRLRLGSVAPNFTAETTSGPIDFHTWLNKHWAILFSHPADFTPVCTTELGAFAKLAPEFAARNVKLIGLSADDRASHDAWVADINETQDVPGAEGGGGGGGGAGEEQFPFPIIADAERRVAYLYDMVTEADVAALERGDKGIVFTVRSVFIIDPERKIRLTMTYPASTGRNTTEVLRVVDALQTADKKGVATPIDWIPGDDVIVPPSVSTADARKKFGEVREVKPYLRYTNVGK